MSTDPIDSDFEADDDFEAEEFFPFAPIQQWAALNPDISADAVAVLVFVMCHLNPLNGKFDTKFGRKRVAERYGRSMDWVDARFKELVTAGALSKQRMWWTDGTREERTTEQFHPETGKRLAPAPNRWRVRMSPPGGTAGYDKPVNIGEFYYPKKIGKRLSKRGAKGVAAGERVPRDLGKRAESTSEEKTASDLREDIKTPGQGVAAGERVGVAAGRRVGVAAGERPELDTGGTSAVGTSGGAQCAAPPRTPPAHITAGDVENVVTAQLDFSTQLQTVRAETCAADENAAEMSQRSADEVETARDAVMAEVRSKYPSKVRSRVATKKRAQRPSKPSEPLPGPTSLAG